MKMITKAQTPARRAPGNIILKRRIPPVFHSVFVHFSLHLASKHLKERNSQGLNERKIERFAAFFSVSSSAEPKLLLSPPLSQHNRVLATF
jgi:hypothetical protein